MKNTKEKTKKFEIKDYRKVVDMPEIFHDIICMLIDKSSIINLNNMLVCEIKVDSQLEDDTYRYVRDKYKKKYYSEESKVILIACRLYNEQLIHSLKMNLKFKKIFDQCIDELVDREILLVYEVNKYILNPSIILIDGADDYTIIKKKNLNYEVKELFNRIEKNIEIDNNFTNLNSEELTDSEEEIEEYGFGTLNE